MGTLDGRGAVVTGGGRGIGRGHCLHLAAQGASVVVNDVDGAEAQKVVDEIAAAGGEAIASRDDVSSRDGA
jgi:3-oxoacyl-[acyl-carrier protein] reductase